MAWTVDGRYRYFIIATEKDAERFRKELEIYKNEHAEKRLAPMHIILDRQIPWTEIEYGERASGRKFQNMMNKATAAGPIQSE
jgi:hypothetical protein